MGPLKRQKIEKVASLISQVEKNLNYAQRILEELRNMGAYEDVEGILGIFDGQQMITEEGKKYDVNPNYAAKSLLIEGDSLKRIELPDEDKVLYKQLEKAPNKQLDGILSKKDGKWCVLTEEGSFRLLDVAVEFRDGKKDSKVKVQVPEDTKGVKWAALERILRDDAVVEKVVEVAEEKPVKAKKEEKKEEKKKPAKPAIKKEVKVKKQKVEKKKPLKTPVKTPARPPAKPSARKRTPAKGKRDSVRGPTVAEKIATLGELGDEDLR